MLYLGAAAAIVVVLILVVALVLPGSSSGNAATAVLPYSGARPVADSTATGFAGGGWTLLAAIGLDSATNVSVPANTTALGSIPGCTYTLVGSVSGLELPAYTGNRSAGVAPAWEFIYRNATDTLAIVSVINGHGMVLVTLTGLECTFYAQLLDPVPSGVIDSPEADAAAAAVSGTFLTDHPNATAEFGLIGGVTGLGEHVGAEWSIEYTTCGLGPTVTGLGTSFNATLNALTGAVLNESTVTNVVCGSSSSSTTAVGATPPGEALLGSATDRPGRSA